MDGHFGLQEQRCAVEDQNATACPLLGGDTIVVDGPIGLFTHSVGPHDLRLRPSSSSKNCKVHVAEHVRRDSNAFICTATQSNGYSLHLYLQCWFPRTLLPNLAPISWHVLQTSWISDFYNSAEPLHLLHDICRTLSTSNQTECSTFTSMGSHTDDSVRSTWNVFSCVSTHTAAATRAPFIPVLTTNFAGECEEGFNAMASAASIHCCSREEDTRQVRSDASTKVSRLQAALNSLGDVLSLTGLIHRGAAQSQTFPSMVTNVVSA